MGGHGIANRTMEHSWPQTNSTDCTPSSCHRSLLSPPPPSPFDEVLYPLPNPHSLIDNRARETRPRIEFWIDRQAGSIWVHTGRRQNGMGFFDTTMDRYRYRAIPLWSGLVRSFCLTTRLSAAVEKTLSQRNRT